MTQQGAAIALEELFAGGGEMGAMMRSLDWSVTPLGPAQHWPQSLKTAVRIMLTSRQAMFVWWGDELINLYNDAYKAIVGGKHPQVLGQPASYVWREIWDQVGPRAEFAMLNNEGTYDEALLLIMERNGYPEETYYTFSYSPVPNDRGGTGGIICANTDDTQRIIGERQLALLRELAARTADARTFDNACTLSAKCLETNPYDLPFAMIYLVDPGKDCLYLAGTSGIDRHHPAVPETIALDSDSVWPFAEAIATHKPCLVSNLALLGSLPTGAWQRPPHQAVIVPIAPSGQTGQAGILVVGLNPFRLFDDNYSGFIDLIAAQIAASIANAQAYEEERKRAEALAELDRAKTIFFSNISHEFRTPLTLMLGPLEDMLANPAGPLPSERSQLETAHRNSLRLLKLVNTLLDFSRIEAGRVQAVYEPTDLAMLTADLAGVFRSAIERAGIQLGVDCPPLPEPVYVDREMWEKIILNLLSNAFKFTFKGEITVALRWADDHVELEIRDTGTGIPAEEMPHLFERFHRVEGARGRTYEGSGIGLSLVQELVKLHGGTIQVSSVVDQGTCFTILIPTGYAHIPKECIGKTRTLASTTMGAATYIEEALRWLPEEDTETQGHGDAGNLESSSPRHRVSPSPRLPLSPSAKILLADDNVDMRNYVKRLLVSQGYEVETVVDGIAAKQRVRQRLPDLVLTDVMMPGLDGLGLLRELRLDPITREIPIILLSARAGEESRIEGLEAGADDYLIKPFSARELLARVEATLKLAQMRQEATQREQELRMVSEAARSAAQSAKENLERVLASINDQFLVLDPEWRYTYVNDRVVEAVGIGKEDLLGKCIWDVFPEILESEFYIQVHRAVAEQRVVQFEYYHSSWQRCFENRVYPSANGVSILVTEITDRKQTEAALRQSEGRLQLALTAAQMFVWELDYKTEWAVCSEVAREVCGFQEGPLDDFIALTHPDDLEQLQQAVEEAITQGTPLSMDYRILSPDGQTRWLSSWGTTYRGLDGQLERMIGVSVDITKRKQVEADRERLLQELALERARFEAVLRQMPAGVMIADAASGKLVLTNEQAKQIVGYDYEQAPQLGEYDQVASFEGFHLDGQPYKADEYPLMRTVGRPLRTSLQTGETITNEEIELHRGDGSRIFMNANSTPIRDIKGHIVAAVVVFQDVTEHKLAQEALRTSEERFRVIVNQATAGITLTDLTGQFLLANQRFCDIVGYSMAELLHKRKQDITHPEDRPHHTELFQRLVTQGQDFVIDKRYIRKDGSEVWVSNHVVATRDSSGKPQNVIAIVLDITERKRAEVERATLLTREQAARVEAEAANRIKDEFLAVLSHELRSPLNPILGWSRLLQTRKFDAARTAEALAIIERNAKLQAELIEDLLDVSRILQGKLSLNAAPVALASAIEAAMETVRLAAEAKSIQMYTQLEPEVGAVSGDASRLQQIIWNILSNAIKFTPPGGRVDIRLERMGSQAQITVSDTGKGIPVDFLPYVFDYFRQADATTTRNFGGLGLGLAIVRHLVELHGGTVQADSPGEGQGATFIVRLPLLPSQPRSDWDSEQPKPSLDLQGVEILVVDDDADTREFVAFLLEQYGARVRAVGSAGAALTALSQSVPDVLLSDIGMPDMDGYMLMQQVRTLPPEQGGQIRAIALTAYAGEINYQQAIAAGFQNHLSKPVEPAELVAVVTSLAKPSRSKLKQ
ncbi:PAS domain S-box protein [Allocoleopsis sp.]|uniref:PAS domain S-box protein n=1 Tax=Allocoleopsis sp. TaxID=3088169 RepID=UPI002FD2F3EB